MTSLFAILERKLQPVPESPGVWDVLRERLNPSLYRPKADPEVEVHAVDDRRRPLYFVLKHPRFESYARLSADEEFLWRQMEGSRTVKDLILAYFTEFGTLAIGRVAGLVTHLVSDLSDQRMGGGASRRPPADRSLPFGTTQQGGSLIVTPAPKSR